MGKFTEGDIVRINGRQMTVLSWPDDDNGYVYAKYDTPTGGETFETLFTSQIEVEGEPVQSSAEVEFVEHGEAPKSTADLSGLDPIPEPESPEDGLARVNAEQDVSVPENAKAANNIGNDFPEGHLPGAESNLPGNDTDDLDPVHAVSLDGDPVSDEPAESLSDGYDVDLEGDQK